MRELGRDGQPAPEGERVGDVLVRG
jgi:hypothetical protein